MSVRPVKRIAQSKATLEGAGVHLRRAFGFGNPSDFDPVLLLDDFRNFIHPEMPKGDELGQMHGFQLWGNLSSALKMTAPRYQEVEAV